MLLIVLGICWIHVRIAILTTSSNASCLSILLNSISNNSINNASNLSSYILCHIIWGSTIIAIYVVSIRNQCSICLRMSLLLIIFLSLLSLSFNRTLINSVISTSAKDVMYSGPFTYLFIYLFISLFFGVWHVSFVSSLERILINFSG